ncbi:MAG: transglutaminase-like domain-containing protein [Shimia sp.]|uniref:transglutaminase-like domain-containing protein n=1 Tax=Shimia sp. TaxID=1954381 RepID=UPI004059727C
MIALDVTVGRKDDAVLVAPSGFSTPDVAPKSLEVSGGAQSLVHDAQSGQAAAVVQPEAEQVRFRWQFSRGGAAYLEAMFQQRDSRFTRSAWALAGEMRDIVDGAATERAGLERIVRHVTGLFQYGHGNAQFYEGHDEMPQLCGLTRGSCVDINAYLIACCRAVGIEAGYVTGYFVPEEKKTHCTDMHCWVVTRADDEVLEWDIAHHMKMGVDQIEPGLNPKPGVRVAMSHSMGWNLPALGVVDLKLLAEPMWRFANGSWERAALDIELEGYDALS